jgi:hypothetical protein
MQAEVQAPSLRPVIFYEGVFATGTLRLWTGVGTLSWDNKDWTGAGVLLSISAVEESADLRANGVSVTLSGISSEVLAVALAQARTGKAGRLWFGCTVVTGGILQVIADPYLCFEGKLDVPTIEENGDTCTVSVSYESRLIDLQQARVWRWTNEDQQRLFPGDKGFAYVADLVDKSVSWGGSNQLPRGESIKTQLLKAYASNR